MNSGENQEITFNVAPKTKADPQTQPGEFDTHNVFASWAYYLPTNKNWNADWKEAVNYIEGSTISYVGNVWKNATTTYAWPHEGTLTFFAYSLNSSKLFLTSGSSYFDCQKFDAGDDKTKSDQYGITGTIDLDVDNNVDFLVADIAPDKNANKPAYNFVGVPTLFRHRLSRVKFAIKKKFDYPNTTITLNSIKFNNLSHAMDYAQFKLDKGTQPQQFKEVLIPRETRTPQVYTKSDVVVTSATDYLPIADDKEVRYIYIPQVFKDVTGKDNIATIDIDYTVDQTIGSNTTITKKYTKKLYVKDIFDKWEMGKKYTINLMFTLNEILFAPAVQDWETVTKEIEI